MHVIGAGLPRTGTLSQKLALEELGLGPTYHWVNLISDLEAVELWHRALDGEDVFEQIFAGHNSSVDWPGGFFYRELADIHPEAKVLLSVRDADAWRRATARPSGTSRAETRWSATSPTRGAKSIPAGDGISSWWTGCSGVSAHRSEAETPPSR